MDMATTDAPKVALVTGGTVGIGRATVTALAENGYLVFSARLGDTGGGTEQENVVPMVMDVTDQQSVDAAISEVMARAGRIDVLVNAAGTYLSGAAEETNDEEAQKVFAVNLFGVMRVTRAVLPIMRRQQSGRIVNLATLSGMASVPFAGVFSASKAALEGYSEALRHEVRPFGVWVSVIQSGGARTGADRRTAQATPLPAYAPFRDGAITGLRDRGQNGMAPEVVARAVLRIAASNAPALRVRVGREAKQLHWFSTLLPQGAFEAGTRRAFKIPSSATSGTS
jgi:NAD(P)-dependent dehydrogenase (short-subunit alcohol dehydrogenase family)